MASMGVLDKQYIAVASGSCWIRRCVRYLVPPGPLLLGPIEGLAAGLVPNPELHLRLGQKLVLDPTTATAEVAGSLVHLRPNCEVGYDHFPYLGAGARPACHAGAIAEFRLPASKKAQQIKGVFV